MSVNLTLGEGLTIGNGITFGAGTGGSTSFTISSADIQVHDTGLWYHGYSNISQTGFTSDGTQLYNGVTYDVTNTTLYNQIVQAYTSLGLTDTNSYAWNVSWTTGGTDIVRLSVIINNVTQNMQLVIAPINQTDTQWQVGNTNGPTQTGTFGFPATFTLLTPTTQVSNNGDWC